MAQNAYRVDLLPPGITYEPVHTIHPQQEPVTDALNPVETALAEQSGEHADSDPSQSQRTKAARYEDNLFGNIREPFIALYNENADIVGRLIIEGILDEIVVKRNNTYYLTRNAHGEVDAAGAVFVDESCQIQKPPENLLLRGQSSVDGRLFSSILSYARGGAEFVRQHALIRMDTLYEEGLYVVIAVVLVNSDPQSPDYFNYAGYPAFQNDWLMERYVSGARQHSLYDIPVDVWPSDRLLTISTLGSGMDRENLVVIARKLRSGETAQDLSAAIGAIK
jgi:sortase B